MAGDGANWDIDSIAVAAASMAEHDPALKAVQLEALFVGPELALQGVGLGDSIYVQFWYRDTLAPEPIGLSCGLRLTWAP